MLHIWVILGLGLDWDLHILIRWVGIRFSTLGLEYSNSLHFKMNQSTADYNKQDNEDS